MAADFTDVDLRDAELFRKFRPELSDNRRRFHDLRKEGTAEAEFVKRGKIPVARNGVQHVGGTGLGVFTGAVAAEQIRNRIGDHQHDVAVGEILRMLSAVRDKLEQGIDLHQLHPGAGVKLCFRNGLENLLRHIVRAGIAVVVRFTGKRAVRLDDHIIHAPCVNAHAFDVGIFCKRFTDPLFELGKDRLNVPVEGAAAFRGTVFKTVHFLKRDFTVFEGADDRAPAGSADVDSQILFRSHVLSFPNPFWVACSDLLNFTSLMAAFQITFHKVTQFFLLKSQNHCILSPETYHQERI